uniref:General transcription factor IIH subunit 4 n=1 Tax=Angiostrongylus cantonensis TaxID=6313 RepID=A0A0K0DMJ0_ANGCA
MWFHMSGKRKAQKRKSRTKESGLDDFDDVVENANDDGCGLSRKYATDIIRLIKCHSKPLNKVAAEFIEIFKERCSLVVGMALLAIYDDLAPTDDIASKIVTVYLIYRVRDIEVALRRRNPGGIDDILGHPFMSFFLNLVESKVVDEICVSYPLPIGIERSIVLRILNGKTEFANMSAIYLLAGGALNDSNLSFSEAESYYVKQSARWPEHLDMVTIPAILPFPDPEDNNLHDLTQDALLISLMERISCEPLKQLPFKTTPLMPPLYPIQPIELGCDDNEILTSTVPGTASLNPNPSMEKTSVLSESATILMASSTVEELSVEQMAEFTRRLLEGKSLTQSETKQMLKSLEDSCSSHKYISLFSRMTDSDFSRLIDFNVKVDNGISQEESVLKNKWYSVSLIETCGSLTGDHILNVDKGLDDKDRPQLPREPLNDYVRYCVRHCLDATPSSNLNRVVRLVAITLKNLLKSGSISATPVFRQSYLRAIMLGTQKCAKINSVEVDIKRRQNEKELGKKAAERWECILKYLALPSEKNMSSVSSTTRELFSAAGFTNDHDASADLEITSAGFQFLLLSPVQQVWTYMIEYLKLETAKGCDIRPILDLLIRVIICVVRGSFSRFFFWYFHHCRIAGSNFSHRAFEIGNNWTNDQTTLLMHMRELGLIFIRKRKDG